MPNSKIQMTNEITRISIDKAQIINGTQMSMTMAFEIYTFI